jgi:hypothetical protein
VFAAIVSENSFFRYKFKTIQEIGTRYILCSYIKYTSEENIESAPRKQRKIGAAEENPETSGPGFGRTSIA